jgi:2-dehydro-3-deoxyphosphogluconate aldolase / (4S)-4-hydroxy-2-oxoglutarate aldolase
MRRLGCAEREGETMSEVLSAFARTRVVPVVVLHDIAQAAPLREALLEGGLAIAEITLRSDAAVPALAAMAEDPAMLVGAGTVLTPGAVDRAVAAGAAFIVSPGFSTAVVRRCGELGVPVVPGVATPTEIQAALEAGVDVCKFFPAEALGGSATLRALSAVFRGVRFVPTGGIRLENMDAYLELPSVLAVGGSWMVAADLVRGGRFEEIARLAAEALRRAAASTPERGSS